MRAHIRRASSNGEYQHCVYKQKEPKGSFLLRTF